MNTVIHSIRSHFKSLNRKPHFCSSHVLANATIDVLLYDNAARTWVTPEGGEFGNLKTPGQAVVQLLQDESGFRIIASRRIDNSMLLNQLIYENFHYKAATPTFHQWKSEMKQVYGLNFPYPEQASIFLESVERSVSAVNAGLTQPTYQSINNASNGVYQEPQMYAEPQHHIQQQQPQQVQRRDIDQESIGSANGHPMGYRGPSYRFLRLTIAVENRGKGVSVSNPYLIGALEPFVVVFSRAESGLLSFDLAASSSSSSSTLLRNTIFFFRRRRHLRDFGETLSWWWSLFCCRRWG
uniref:WH1 domain-containing protein n=1 Tax=Panagrellus redivivus TaxID=6233 RepID=A0A7E4W6Y7_PANRE